MDAETTKATYINLYLLAVADGKIDPTEQDYLKRFAASAGITDEQAHQWTEEVQSSGFQFRPIEDREAARSALAVMARMVRVDDEFGPEEQAAYVNMGKAVGFTQDELGAALREYWNKDPLQQPAPPPAESAANANTPALLVIQEDIGDTGKLKASTDDLPLQYVSMDQLDKIDAPPHIVVFHAAEERNDSKRRLALLIERFENIPVTFIARRDQAPQIGFLLERGAARCFVEPLYSGEIARAASDMV